MKINNEHEILNDYKKFLPKPIADYFWFLKSKIKNQIKEFDKFKYEAK